MTLPTSRPSPSIRCTVPDSHKPIAAAAAIARRSQEAKYSAPLAFRAWAANTRLEPSATTSQPPLSQDTICGALKTRIAPSPNFQT